MMFRPVFHNGNYLDEIIYGGMLITTLLLFIGMFFADRGQERNTMEDETENEERSK